MDEFDRFQDAAVARHGVGDVALAARFGVPANRFYRRTAREGWEADAPGVRVVPGSRRSVQRAVLAVCLATTHLAAASGRTAAWSHGLRPRPPSPASVVIANGTRAVELPGVRAREARWLEDDDLIDVDGVPTLTPSAMVISASHLGPRSVRPLLIDATFHGLTDPDEVLARVERIGPIPGRGSLVAVARWLADRRVESVFQDDVAAVLTLLGYAPTTSTIRIATPDGRAVTPDVPLPRWLVAVDPQGDAFHRSRQQRRSDRRRLAAYAGTDWVPVPVDWRDWYHDRDHVLEAIDAAIASQRRRGIGTEHEPPRRTAR